ncbi:O(6)-methylguanine-induced apoptosis 2-like [Anneissia japonica]|uniref:O(6)-methylguanine-induced apoptosis 2-like n=1 Tax=Anneissia japonica TaxID=1529436 RepID=UPI0014259EC6|nr:O(6)-methylguanine-induced apoptosis 2-like [Anneissia japonica]
MADSVQILDQNYRRCSGQVRSGKIHKGSGVTAASSSIPSKYQTIVIPNHDRKGFGSQSKRFGHGRDINENPGPGSYVGHGQATSDKSSYSKKGYGVGFVSKTQRNVRHKGTPGPGAAAYSLPSLLSTRNDFNKTVTTSSFQKRIAVPTEDKASSNPAPNKYDISNQNNKKHYGSQVQASFRSTSKRVDYYKPAGDFPGPNQYNVNDSLLHDSVRAPNSCFKSTTIRKMNSSPSANPGPGHYKPHEAPEPVNKTLMPRKHYLCISAPAMPLPPPLPDPGPGSYQLVNYNGEEKHYMSSSMFVSNTSRWTGDDVKNANDPGPASYRPTHHANRQSFLYNAQKKWVFP